MSEVIVFNVDGLPMPKGSKTLARRGGRTFMLDGRSTKAVKAYKEWTAAVERAARDASTCLDAPLDGPVAARYVFRLPRPKSVRRSMPFVKPDLDKLVRAVNDGIGKAVDADRNPLVLADDARIVAEVAMKRYALPHEQPGVTVALGPWVTPEAAELDPPLGWAGSPF